VFSLKLVMQTNTYMKVLKSSHINPFGGLNFVLHEFDRLKLGDLLCQNLPKLPSQSKYSWKDILYSFWSIYFCGGDCIEDLSGNFSHHLKGNKFHLIPSPDRVLKRFQEISKAKEILSSKRSKAKHEFSINIGINRLNIELLKIIGLKNKDNHVLDYDNTIIFNNKADSVKTYKKASGYCPGVGIIGKNIVYIENRNGNSNVRFLQEDTLKRMFSLLKDQGITIHTFRADSGSYVYEALKVILKYTTNFYIKARMSARLATAISKIKQWNQVMIGNEICYRGEIEFTPFVIAARKDIAKGVKLKTYRLVVTKTKRKDKQTNLFTGDDFLYSAILTNNTSKPMEDIVSFYNQRGTIEKEFDVLKNDFGWKHMPFSKLEQNTVFLLFTAMCRNLYQYIITRFSKIYKNLKANFRIKKFIFRFICIPAKWIKTARQYKLKVYGNIHFKT